MTNPTDELIQRAEALAEEKIAGAVETIRDALVHVHSRDEGAYRDAALALSVLSSSGRELVPELVRALKEAIRDRAVAIEAGLLFEQAAAEDRSALASANRRNSETIEALKKAGQHINSLRDEYSERDTTKDEYPDYIRAALLSNPAVAQETKE